MMARSRCVLTEVVVSGSVCLRGGGGGGGGGGVRGIASDDGRTTKDKGLNIIDFKQGKILGKEEGRVRCRAHSNDGDDMEGTLRYCCFDSQSSLVTAPSCV